jgi:hypothetical protein
VDEAGQPSSEPARVSSTGGGAAAGHTGTWRIVSETGSLPQAEPFGPRWRSPAAADGRGGPENYPRYEMVAPVSPAVGGEHAGYDAGEPDIRDGEIEQVIGEADRENWSAPWAPAEHRALTFDRHPAVEDDDMPVLARATAANQQAVEDAARDWSGPDQPVAHARPTSAPPVGSGAHVAPAAYGAPPSFGGPPPPGPAGHAAPPTPQYAPQPAPLQGAPHQAMPQPQAAPLPPQAAAQPVVPAGFAPAYPNRAPARPLAEALGPVNRAAVRAPLPDPRGPLPEQRAAFQDPWAEQAAPERSDLGESAEAVRDASAAAQALSATQGALSRTRAARAHAVTDDFTAVGATFAAAHDARGELSECEPGDGDLPPLRQVAGGGALPQRVPAAPDVPDVPDDEPEHDQVQEPPAAPVASPELARIATHLRSDADLLEEAPGRPDGFDMEAVIAAVRGVEGVRDAQLRQNPNGVHTLRLDLADGADGARVSREVARLLKRRMGLAAEPRRTSGAAGTPAPAGPIGPLGQSRNAFPVAGAAPAPVVPMPASAAEHLGGPAAANAAASTRGAEERGMEPQRRHAATGLHGRGSTDVHSGLQAAPAPATPPLRRAARAGEGSRVVLDQVQVNTLGLDATVTVRLVSGGGPAEGRASGPSVDGYVLRLAAVAAASAVDQLLSTVDTWEQQRGRCFVEHAAVVPLGSCEVAVVVVLLACGGWVEQLSGAALVNGDPRQAVVRATLAAVNRRLDGLLG